MTTLLKFLLTAHVIFGLFGVIAFYAIWLGLLKAKPNWRALHLWAAWGTILLFLSWISGGYYYVKYYGPAVRAVIKAGQYPWAHSIFMEAKEHIFLFLPFLAIAAGAILHYFEEDLENHPQLWRALTWLAGVVVILGTIITLSGAVISGAVR